MRITALFTFAIVSTSFAQDSLPEAAQRLKEGYTRAIKAANMPITERYIAELARLKAAAMKAGKLEEAVAIENEISSFEAVDSKSLVDAYVGTWEGSDHKFILNADGSARTNKGTTGKWVVSDKSLVVTWNNGRICNFKVSENINKLDGVEKMPNGAKGAELYYTRKK